jgi:sugar-specific transcriptional regulator TrmB
MEITEVLNKIGLNEKEASVYLALLELGTASVQSIAQKATLKRPTTYLILDELQAKELVSVMPQSKKALFTAESPEHLINELSKRQELLKRFLPDLLALHNAKKEKPKVQLFYGKEGIGKVYDILFESPEVWFFATISDAFSIFPEMPKELMAKVRARKIKVREILTQTEQDIKYAKTIPVDEQYQIRVIPASMRFMTDNAIFGDHVVFFSYHPQIFAVMITSREVSQSLKTLYELAWQSALPYKK